MRRHVESVHKGRKYPCDKCDKFLSSYSSMKCHQKCHKEVFSFCCKDCDKLFKRKENLETSEKLILWSLQKIFSRKDSLERHENVCTGEKLLKRWRIKNCGNISIRWEFKLTEKIFDKKCGSVIEYKEIKPEIFWCFNFFLPKNDPFLASCFLDWKSLLLLA